MTPHAIRQAKLLFLLVLALIQNGRAADRLAVVIDVSGSMRAYGSWQTDAKDAIAAILNGRPLPPRWNVEPGGADLSSYTCGAQDRVMLLRFGSVQPAAEYPYFTAIQNSLTPGDLETQFPINPASYTESRTNGRLAESVAMHALAGDNGVAQVIMLSDFYTDASLSPPQIAFINDTEDKFAKYTLATLSWTGNPRVQIKLLRFVSQLHPVQHDISGSQQPLGLLHLLPARYDERSQTVQFSWTYEGQPPPEKYDVKVTDARGTTLFSKYGLGGRSVTYPKAACGPLRWKVTAFLQDGRSIEQSSDFNVQCNKGATFALVLFIVALGAAVVIALILLKKYGPPDLFDKLKRRPDTDI